jgi:hypothetical protein
MSKHFLEFDAPVQMQSLPLYVVASGDGQQKDELSLIQSVHMNMIPQLLDMLGILNCLERL